MKKKSFFRGEKGCSFLVGVFCVFLWLCSFFEYSSMVFFHARFGTTFQKSDGKNDCRKKVIEKEATEQSDSKTLFH